MIGVKSLKWTPESISALRKNLNLTQKEFGKLIGVSEKSVWQLENRFCFYRRTETINALDNLSVQLERKSQKEME